MTQEIETKVVAIADQVKAFVVTTHEQAGAASDFLGAIKVLQREVRNVFGPLKEAASAAHKKIVAEEKRHLEPLDRAETEIKSRIGVFLDGERRKREAAERAAREEAERIARQQRAEEEAARRAAEDKRLEAAMKLEAAGKAAEAARMLDAPLPPTPSAPPPPLVVPHPPARRVEGVSTRETFRADVQSIAELAGYVAANPEKSMLLEPNIVELNRLARTIRARGAQIVPGVRCVSDVEVVKR